MIIAYVAPLAFPGHSLSCSRWAFKRLGSALRVIPLPIHYSRRAKAQTKREVWAYAVTPIVVIEPSTALLRIDLIRAWETQRVPFTSTTSMPVRTKSAASSVPMSRVAQGASPDTLYRSR
jgi:hypothetical protein